MFGKQMDQHNTEVYMQEHIKHYRKNHKAVVGSQLLLQLLLVKVVVEVVAAAIAASVHLKYFQ